jgi:hypothetical protein
MRSFPSADHKVTRAATLAAFALGRLTHVTALARWQSRHPLHAYLLLTTRCNMSYDDCYFVDVINKKTVGKLDFDLEQIKTNYARVSFEA